MKVTLKADEKPKTPCGYPEGPLRASDGTVWDVLKSGQIVRRDLKLSKAERKRRKRERRKCGSSPASS